MSRPAALAAFLAVALVAGAAQAIEDRDIIGTWQVDAEAYRRDMAEALEDYIAEMPEPMRAQMREMMLGQVDEMHDTEEAYAEFQAGGQMIFHAPDEPPLRAPGASAAIGSSSPAPSGRRASRRTWARSPTA